MFSKKRLNVFGKRRTRFLKGTFQLNCQRTAFFIYKTKLPRKSLIPLKKTSGCALKTTVAASAYWLAKTATYGKQ